MPEPQLEIFSNIFICSIGCWAALFHFKRLFPIEDLELKKRQNKQVGVSTLNLACVVSFYPTLLCMGVIGVFSFAQPTGPDPVSGWLMGHGLGHVLSIYMGRYIICSLYAGLAGAIAYPVNFYEFKRWGLSRPRYRALVISGWIIAELTAITIFSLWRMHSGKP
jgi:hypothetical protein